MVQQLYKNQPSLDQVKILNVSCENGRKSSLNISLEEILIADVADEIAVIGDETARVSRF